MTSEPKAPSAVSVRAPQIGPFAQLIFGSRWLQVPLYVGLIVAQAVYVLLFLKELWHLVVHEPEWLSHVNASVLKIKLAMAIIGISSISLLRTFIEAGNLGTTRSNFTESGVMWQVLIHLTFIISAIGIAWVDRLGDSGQRKGAGHG
jgi:uncharacterized membrane protein YqhA